MFDICDKTRRIVCQKAANRISRFDAKNFGKDSRNFDPK